MGGDRKYILSRVGLLFLLGVFSFLTPSWFFYLSILVFAFFYVYPAEILLVALGRDLIFAPGDYFYDHTLYIHVLLASAIFLVSVLTRKIIRRQESFL